MTEDQILSRVAAERVLRRLHPADRQLLELVFWGAQPADWTKWCPRGHWPPTYKDLGRYLGRKYEGRMLSEAAVRYRRDVVLRMLAGERGHLRRDRVKTDLQQTRTRRKGKKRHR